MVRTKTSSKKIVENVIEYLLDKGIKVKLAVIFGSYASGEQTETSDIDIAIFSEDLEKKCLKERVELATDVSLHCGNAVELHFYPVSTLAKARATNFIGYILRNGKEVYKDGKFLAWR